MQALRRLSFACIVTLLTIAGTALAQAPPTADPKEMARSAGEEGLELYRAGKFVEAHERFAMAEQIAHSPVFVLWMARSKRGTQELLAAKRLFERVAAEDLAAGASPKWLAARSEAKTELAALVAKIPKVSVTAPGAPPNAKLELDGNAIEPNQELEVDPGAHVARAFDGARTAEKKVQVEEGSTTIELRFDSDDSGEPAKGSLLPGALVLGGGLLGLAGGTITGAYALVLAGEIKDGCDGNVCLASDEQKAADADTLARASTGLFIAGGVVSAVGVVLLVVRPRLGGDTPVALVLEPTGARALIRF